MKYITAIDLGTTKVVGLVGERTQHGFKIVAYSENPSHGVMRGEVVNINEVLNAIMPCIKDLQAKTREKISKVFVGIAGQHIRSQAESHAVNRSDWKVEITEEEVRHLEQNMYSSRVSFGEEILHVIPQCYHVDDYLTISNPVGMLGKRIEANYRLFIGKTISAEHTKRCIERAGLKLERLILEPLASAKAVLTDDEKELGVAMVDIGGGTTDLLIYSDNVIRHAAVIPFGGNVITEDIRQGCSVPQRLAEQIKVQFGSCFSDLAPSNKSISLPGIGGNDSREISFRTLASIIEARVSEILEAVKYEMQLSGYADSLRAGIVLTGGGALMNNLSDFVKFKLGYEARIAKPILEDNSCPEIAHSAYSCAVGLLLKGWDYQNSKRGNNSKPIFEKILFPELFTSSVERAPKAPKISKTPRPPKPPKTDEYQPTWLDKFFNNIDDTV